MDKLITTEYGWFDIVLSIAFLAVLYIILNLAKRMIGYLRSEKTFRVNISESIEDTLDKIILLFEPLTALFLAIYLLVINPYLIGFVGILFTVFTFSYIRNYFIGRTLMLNATFSNARQIDTGGMHGSITRRGRLGLWLQTAEGIAHIPYLTLARQGFTVISGARVGHQVLMTLTSEKESMPVAKLHAMLLASPFIDHQISPTLEETEDKMINVKVILKEMDYLDDLEAALHEWGFTIAHHQFKSRNKN